MKPRMYAKQPWRLVPYSENDGATNMAVDEAILEAHLRGLVPPTLRLYGFTPPAVSLGFNQIMPDGLPERAASRGLEVIRRPTGGRAVLHLNDLTYSFTGTSIAKGERLFPGHHMQTASPPEDQLINGFLSPSVSGAYKQICRGLQLAFEQLDLCLEIGGMDASYRKLHDCFGLTTGSDLQLNGKKMIGSAQLRRRHAVLQHGSILLHQDQLAMPRLLGQAKELPAPKRHANLFEVVGRPVNLNELTSAVQRGFSAAFEVHFQDSCLCEFEINLARELRAQYVIPGPILCSQPPIEQ